MLQSRHRTRPIRVALCIVDRALRADIADACQNAEIVVAAPDEPIGDVDVVVADRPIETSAPLIVLVSDEIRERWPVDVRAALPTDGDPATLAAAITVAAAGYALVPRSNVARADMREDAGTWAEATEGADELHVALSPRERDVLALLAEGASNKEIARALAVSVHTAKFHVASLIEKLGARSRTEATAIAIRA